MYNKNIRATAFIRSLTQHVFIGPFIFKFIFITFSVCLRIKHSLSQNTVQICIAEDLLSHPFC